MINTSICSNNVIKRKLARNASIINLEYDEYLLGISDNFIDVGITTAFEYVHSIVEAYHQRKLSKTKEDLNNLVGLLAYIKIPRLRNIAIQLYKQLSENLNVRSVSSIMRKLQKESLIAERLYKSMEGAAGELAVLIYRTNNVDGCLVK